MSEEIKKGKVTGLGGVFFKSNDPEALKKWYEEHLGLPCDQYGHLFTWRKDDSPEQKGYTQFSVFNSDSEYLKPSEKPYMLNFIVDDVKLMVERLQKSGMQVIGEITEYEYGKFAWVMDPDGNKIELWEPVDQAFG
ncbi:MAG TPA: VOC family protein [Bacteroidales bacterium]|nr:VOC family protein [Bacteroidales bacterium]HPE56159.1 VOC family protein [Bacteroidales bacterium]HRX98032.1 VOC family protein [Bacteroidales bacterium]